MTNAVLPEEPVAERSTPLSPGSGQKLDVGAVLARNTLWNYLGFATNLVVNLVLFPFVVRRLGAGPAGIWLLLGSVTGYMGLLELGIVPALMQRIAAALGKGTRSALDETVSTAVGLMSVMTLVGLQLIWLAPRFAGILHLPDDLAGQAVTAISLAIAGVALRMPLAPFQAVLLGCQRQDRCNQLWIVLAITKATATLILLLLHVGVVGIVAMEALAHLAAGVLQVRWVRQELPALHLAPRHVRWNEARDLLGFGSQVTLAGIFVLIIEQTDKLVIGAFLPIEQVTMYSAAWKLYMLAYAIPTTLIQALSPVMANLHGAGDSDRLRSAFFRMTRYSGALALPIAATLGLSSGWILRIWMGPAFANVYPVVAVLIAGFAVTALNHPGHSALFATGQIKRRLWVYDAPQALMNLALSIWLVRSLGILGVAVGTLVPALIMQPVFLALLAGSINVKLADWRRVVVRVVLPVAAAFAPAVVVRFYAGPFAGVVFAACVGSSLLCAIFYWFYTLDDEEQAWLLSRIRAARTRTKIGPSVSQLG